MSYTCKDIRLFFTSSCCNMQMALGPNEDSPEDDTSCQSHAKIRHRYKVPDNIIDYLVKKCKDTSNYAKSTTITIGNKRYGSLSAKDQYKHIKKAIKKHIPYRSEKKYLYTFELQNNGQLHAHGLELGTYQATFIESFGKFGRRNTHNESYQNTKHVRKYLEYMNKDPIFEPVHNIMKKEIKQANTA